MRCVFQGPVEQVAAGSINNIHHWLESAPPDDARVSQQCPQCGRLTWRYTGHCIHCYLDLVGWRRRQSLRRVFRVTTILFLHLGRVAC